MRSHDLCTSVALSTWNYFDSGVPAIGVSMSRRRLLPVLPRLALLLVLAGCGGGGDSGDPPPSDIGTLAYVTTECRDTADGFSESQALHILHGDRDVTVMETPGVGPAHRGGRVCRGLPLHASVTVQFHEKHFKESR